MNFCCLLFFKQRMAYEMRISDWSSDVCSSDLIGILHEAAQRPFGCAEVISQAAPDAEIAVKFMSERHCASPATGHGFAIERRPSTSSFASIIVEARARWRNMSPISASDAPLRTVFVARLWRRICDPTYGPGGVTPVAATASFNLD